MIEKVRVWWHAWPTAGRCVTTGFDSGGAALSSSGPSDRLCRGDGGPGQAPVSCAATSSEPSMSDRLSDSIRIR